MIRILKIFLSSTSDDLAPWRRHLGQVLQEQGYQLLSMDEERFNAFPLEPATVCAELAAECDLFIGLYGSHYGSTPGESRTSFTEIEFEAASSKGVPRLCYFLAPEAGGGASDEPPWKQKALKRLKDRISVELVRAEFSGPDDLAKKVQHDIGRFLNGEPLGHGPRAVARQWREWATVHRQSMFRRELDDRPPIIASPLADLWDRFITAKPWHIEMEHWLERIGSLASRAGLESLEAQCRGLWKQHGADSYPLICVRLKAFLEDVVLPGAIQAVKKQAAVSGDGTLTPAESLRIEVGKFLSTLGHPRFNRCFLVSGGLGSGRTHFIATQLPSTDPHPMPNELSLQASPFLLFLEPPCDKEWSLSKMLRQSLAMATGIQWQDLGQFSRLMGKSIEPSSKSTSKHLQIVIVLDNLELWLRSKSFATELAAAMEDTTKLRSVYWLLTIHDQYLDQAMVKPLRSLWDEYAFRPPRRVASIKSGTETDDDVTHSPAEILTQGRWIALEDLNCLKRLGLRLLRQHKLGPMDSSENSRPERKSQDDPRILCNPFPAWLAIDLSLLEQRGASEPMRTRQPHRMIDLRYIDYMTLFWKRRTDRVTLPKNLTLSELDNFVTLCARFVAKQNVTAFPTNLLLHEVSVWATQTYSSRLHISANAESALDVLQDLGLLRHLPEQRQSDGLLSPRHGLSFEAFWAWRMASDLEQSPRTVNQLELCRGSDDRSEAIFQFYLLCVEQRRQREEAVHIWNRGLEDERLPSAAVWFAGAKAKPELQKRIYHKATEWVRRTLLLPITGLAPHPEPPAGSEVGANALAISDLTGAYPNRRSLFAFMYFCCESSTGSMTVPQRLASLRSLFKAISGAGLARYYLYIVQRHLPTIQTSTELCHCVRAMQGSEAMGITDELAHEVIGTLLVLQEKEVTDQPALALSQRGGYEDGGPWAIRRSEMRMTPILYACVSTVLRWIEQPFWDQSLPDRGRTFRDWLLRDLCMKLTADLGILDTYALLEAQGWFALHRRGSASGTIDSPNIALGWAASQAIADWYLKRERHRPDSFSRLVRHLLKRGGSVEVENAYYILYHALHWDVEKGGPLHPELLSLLGNARTQVEQDPRARSLLKRKKNQKFLEALRL